jgi:hypothetical protein
MPDISMCRHKTCPNRTKCYRHEASGTEPKKYAQTYAAWEPTINGEKVECDGYCPRREQGEQR